MAMTQTRSLRPSDRLDVNLKTTEIRGVAGLHIETLEVAGD